MAGIIGKAMHPIHIKKSHEGRLHEKLGVPAGQPIPQAKIKAAENSASPALRKEAQFADNAQHFNHNPKTHTVVREHVRAKPGKGK